MHVFSAETAPDLLTAPTEGRHIRDPLFDLKCWIYRVTAYLLTTFMDDAAWLAFMFC